MLYQNWFNIITQRAQDVKMTLSLRRIDIETTSFWHHIPTGKFAFTAKGRSVCIVCPLNCFVITQTCGNNLQICLVPNVLIHGFNSSVSDHDVVISTRLCNKGILQSGLVRCFSRNVL